VRKRRLALSWLSSRRRW